MKNNLILFTKKFPFDYGEEFILSELDYLESKFDQMTIISCQTSKHSVKIKKISNKIKVFNIVSNNSKFRYIFDFIHGIKFLSNNDLRNELKITNNIFQKMASIMYFGKVQRMLSSCIPIISRIDYNPNDNILLYSYWFFDITHLAIYLKEKFFSSNKCKIISRAHGFDLYEYRSPTHHIPFRNWCLSKINSLYVCSKDGSDYINKLYQGFSNKIIVSYLGTKDFGFPEYIRKQEFHIVTCSWLAPLKRVDLIASALKIMQDRGFTNIRWSCIGTGKLLNKIKKYSKKYLSKIKVDFLGNLQNYEVLNFYSEKNIDIFMNVSRTEGLPVSIMEAQSFGIPSIATDVGGTREIVIDYYTGRLISPEIRIDQLALEIIKWMELPIEFIYEMRRNCRNYWLENFYSNKNYIEFSQNIIKDTDE